MKPQTWSRGEVGALGRSTKKKKEHWLMCMNFWAVNGFSNIDDRYQCMWSRARDDLTIQCSYHIKHNTFESAYDTPCYVEISN